jgi:hypothetical protein
MSEKADMAEKEDKATTDDAIGRPGPWREGRYQQAGEPLDNSVAPEEPLDSKNPVKLPAAEKISPGPVSTAVHLDEYTSASTEPADPQVTRKPE